MGIESGAPDPTWQTKAQKNAVNERERRVDQTIVERKIGGIRRNPNETRDYKAIRVQAELELREAHAVEYPQSLAELKEQRDELAQEAIVNNKKISDIEARIPTDFPDIKSAPGYAYTDAALMVRVPEFGDLTNKRTQLGSAIWSFDREIEIRGVEMMDTNVLTSLLLDVSSYVDGNFSSEAGRRFALYESELSRRMVKSKDDKYLDSVRFNLAEFLRIHELKLDVARNLYDDGDGGDEDDDDHNARTDDDVVRDITNGEFDNNDEIENVLQSFANAIRRPEMNASPDTE